jgi:hypothetical protein
MKLQKEASWPGFRFISSEIKLYSFILACCHLMFFAKFLQLDNGLVAGGV